MSIFKREIKQITFLIVLILISGLYSISLSSNKKVPNIVLICWDGVQYNHLKECLSRDELPNLGGIIEDGSFIDVWIYHETDTKAGHSEMLTGYPPEITGVYSNKLFKPIPEGYTIFERLEDYFGGENINSVMLTGKEGNIGSKGPGKKKGERVRSFYGEPFYRVKENIDIWDGDELRDAEDVGEKALEYLEGYSDKLFFVFFHFSDPEYMGYEYGENSDEYNEAIINCDVWLGKILSKLEESDRFDNTAVFVTTDHGFNEGTIGHLHDPHIWLVCNKSGLIGPGDQADIVPTIMDIMGIDVSKFQPPFPEYPGQSLLKKRKKTFVEPEPPEEWEKRLNDLIDKTRDKIRELIRR